MLQEKSRSLARLRRETQLGDICATQKLLRDATRRDFREDLLLIITTFDKVLRDAEKNDTKEELPLIAAIAEKLFQQAAKHSSEEDLLFLVNSLIASEREQSSAQMIASALHATRSINSPQARNLLIATSSFCKKSDGDAALQRLNRALVFDGSLYAAHIPLKGFNGYRHRSVDTPIPEENLTKHQPPFSNLRIVTGGVSIGLNGQQEGLLANLEWIRGNLIIEAEYSNATLILPRLRRIEGALVILHERSLGREGEPILERIKLPQLCFVERIVLCYHSKIDLHLPSLPHPVILHNFNADKTPPYKDKSHSPPAAQFAIANTGPDKEMEVLLEALGHPPVRFIVGWLLAASRSSAWHPLPTDDQTFWQPHPLFEGENLIGRATLNGLLFPHDTLFVQRHCAVFYEDGHFFFHIINSPFNIWPDLDNGELQNGSRILIGDTIFKLKIRDADCNRIPELTNRIKE